MLTELDMTTGMRTIRKIQELQILAHELGFKFANAKHFYGSDHADILGLVPRDDQLPHYNRNAELWCGSLEELDDFFKGITFAKNYYKMLNLVDDSKIHKREQLERNRQLLDLLKDKDVKLMGDKLIEIVELSPYFDEPRNDPEA